MKNPYKVTALCLIGVAIILKAGIANALLLFLLVGAIPGTNYNIPAAGMLFLVMVPAWVVFVRLMMSGAIQAKIKTIVTSEPKKRLVRKRFERA
jgi:hypothetical protein